MDKKFWGLLWLLCKVQLRSPFGLVCTIGMFTMYIALPAIWFPQIPTGSLCPRYLQSQLNTDGMLFLMILGWLYQTIAAGRTKTQTQLLPYYKRVYPASLILLILLLPLPPVIMTLIASNICAAFGPQVLNTYLLYLAVSSCLLGIGLSCRSNSWGVGVVLMGMIGITAGKDTGLSLASLPMSQTGTAALAGLLIYTKAIWPKSASQEPRTIPTPEPFIDIAPGLPGLLTKWVTSTQSKQIKYMRFLMAAGLCWPFALFCLVVFSFPISIIVDGTNTTALSLLHSTAAAMTIPLLMIPSFIAKLGGRTQYSLLYTRPDLLKARAITDCLIYFICMAFMFGLVVLTTVIGQSTWDIGLSDALIFCLYSLGSYTSLLAVIVVGETLNSLTLPSVAIGVTYGVWLWVFIIISKTPSYRPAVAILSIGCAILYFILLRARLLRHDIRPRKTIQVNSSW